MKLSTEQRILVHLSRFAGNEGRWEAPYGISQAGISASLHIPQSTISRALKSLKERGLVQDRLMYIRGEKRKKSAYFLTSAGLDESERIMKELIKEPVRFVTEDGTRTMEIADVIKISRERGVELHPLDIYDISRRDGVFELRAHAHPGNILYGVPEMQTGFVGRQDVIEEIMEWIEESPVIIIKGMAGMGKSALLSTMARRLSERYHVFWYGIRAGRASMDLTKELNDFLREVGKRPVERRAGGKGFFAELKDLNALLIFDDLHFSDESTMRFLRDLGECMLSEPCIFRVLASTREELEMFRKSEVARGKVHEITLRPLKKEELARLFPEEELERVHSLTGGIPLFVQLYRNVGFRLSDAERILDEEVFSSLSDDEREALKIMAVHRVPVYPEALGDRSEPLDGLIRKMLVFEVGDGKIDMHDLLKEVVYRYTPIEEKKELHRKASEYYLSQWSDEKDRFEAVHHFHLSGDWEKAARTALGLAGKEPVEYAGPVLELYEHMDMIPEDFRGELLILMGDVLSSKGMWDEAIERYEEARGYLGDIEEIKERIAAANIGMENWDESLRMENELLERAREREDRREMARHLLLIGSINLRSGHLKKAIENYSRALKILKSIRYREGLAVAENNLATAYIRIGELDEAERHIMESLRHSKSKGRIGTKALYNLGYIYELRGDIKGAERCYYEALKRIKEPETAALLIQRLIAIILKEGRWGEAIALAKRWEEKVPERERWRIYESMADAYRKGRMYEDAIKARRRALQSSPGDTRLRLIEDLIFAGRIEEALHMLEREERLAVPWEQERMMRISELKGRALSIKGERDAAMEAYMEAVRLAEETGDADSIKRLRKLLDDF